MEKRFTNSVKIRYPPSREKLIKLLQDNIKIIVIRLETIQKVILFGSYAKNTIHYGSDVDLVFIVSKRQPDDFYIIYESLYQFSSEYEWSPLIKSEQEIETLKLQNNKFWDAITENGIVLYAIG